MFRRSRRQTATPLEVTNGQTSTVSDLPEGAVVTLTEVTPTVSGVLWGDPAFTINGVATNQLTIGADQVVEVQLTNTANTPPPVPVPSVDIEKGDDAGNDADTPDAAVAYSAGESRQIRFVVKNNGSEALKDAFVADGTITGGSVEALECTFPGAAAATAGVFADGTWRVDWVESSTGAATWAPGSEFPCVATLTLDGSAVPHADAATVDAVGAGSGIPVRDRDDYHAFTGAVQIVKYDGRGDYTPAATDSIPNKPLTSEPERDANAVESAVEYQLAEGESSTGPQPVHFAVTNTGTTWLTDVIISDTTNYGPDLTNVTCDFASAGDATAPTSGLTWAGPWQPKTTFFCSADLDLSVDDAVNATHGDLAAVDAEIVKPQPNPDYDPADPNSAPFTDQPALDPGTNQPVKSGVRVNDDDPFNAKVIGAPPAPPVPFVDIEKVDDAQVDADTPDEAVAYTAGETRGIQFTVTNTGNEALKNVVVTDDTITGGSVEALECTFPGAAAATAGVLTDGTWRVDWADSASGAATWSPSASFPCEATLTLDGSASVHADAAVVDAVGVGSGTPVRDRDDYHAFTGAVQIVKYDGRGDYTPESVESVPNKPLTLESARDANTADSAIEFELATGETSTGPQPVQFAVTNTGTTWLTAVVISDETSYGPALTNVTCDFTGARDSSAPTSGLTWVGPWAPKTTFFCSGDLDLSVADAADSTHGDIAKVDAEVVKPQPNPDYDPADPTSPPFTDQPSRDPGTNQPISSGKKVTDNDPFHARVVGAPPAPLGGFTVSKAITGDAAATVPSDATFDVTYSYEVDGVPTSGALTVTSGSPATLGSIPAGTVVTLTESTPPSIAGVQWAGAEFTIDGAVTHVVTISADTTVEVLLTNTTTTPPPTTGGFTVSKAVTGDGAASVPSDATFEVTYSYDLDGTAQSGTLTLAPGASDGVQGLPAGTVVTFVEAAPQPVAGVVWGTPEFSVDGSATDQITIGAEQTIAVVLTNPTTTPPPSVGGFSILKQVTGDAAGAVPAGTAFDVTYEYLSNGTPVSGVVAVTAGTPAQVDGLPDGAVVTLSEATPPSVDGVVWGTPVFTVGGVPSNQVTIGADQVVEVELTNSATTPPPSVGSFSVTKAVTGEAADAVPADASFEVTYSYDLEGAPTSGTVRVGVNGTETVGPLLAGTVVTLAEIQPLDTDAVKWGAPVFTIDGVTTNQLTIGVDETVEVRLTNSTSHPPVPGVDIEKRDDAGEDADTPDAAAAYDAGESREIQFTVANNGNEALKNVVVTDDTVVGGSVEALECTFPGAAAGSAGVLTDGTWRVEWAETFAGSATWQPSVEFPCVATLALDGSAVLHADAAVVEAIGVGSGIPARDRDDYHAFTGAVQIVKYDGRGDYVPAATASIPNKPLTTEPARDANTEAAALEYKLEPGQPATGPQSVRFAVTNTGTTWLTKVVIADVTDYGPALTNVSCDFTGAGDVAAPTSGLEWVGPWAPQTTFYCSGDLDLSVVDVADATHGDLASVDAEVVKPQPNPAYDPADPASKPFTDEPSRDPSTNEPVGSGLLVRDDDPFNAKVHVPTPSVDIEKLDDQGADADVPADAVAYEPDEIRTITFPVINTGDEPLRNVVVTDQTIEGGTVVDFECTFPGETGPTAGEIDGESWTATWSATFAKTMWSPGDRFTCQATLTLTGRDAVHSDSAKVDAIGAATGKPVGDHDEYHAFTGAVQIIKYDGRGSFKPVTGLDGMPVKALLDAVDRDANTKETAVGYASLSDGTTGSQLIEFAVTNVGETWLADVEIADEVFYGPELKDITCDFTGTGDFTAPTEGTTWAGPWEPGTTFYCEGRLTLVAGLTGDSHGDDAQVKTTVIKPEPNPNYKPGDPANPPFTDQPARDPKTKEPLRSTVKLADNDPFHAIVPPTPPVSLAQTGTAVASVIGGGTGLLALGLVFLGFGKRRREVNGHKE